MACAFTSLTEAAYLQKKIVSVLEVSKNVHSLGIWRPRLQNVSASAWMVQLCRISLESTCLGELVCFAPSSGCMASSRLLQLAAPTFLDPPPTLQIMRRSSSQACEEVVVGSGGLQPIVGLLDHLVVPRANKAHAAGRLGPPTPGQLLCIFAPAPLHIPSSVHLFAALQRASVL